MTGVWRRSLRAVLGGVGATALVACGIGGSEPAAGVYRAIIEVPSGELPFLLELAATADDRTPDVQLIADEQRLPAQQVNRSDQGFRVVLPGGAALLEFTARGSTLRGTMNLPGADGRTEPLGFRAEAGDAYRFFAESATDNVDVAGRWSMTIEQPSGGTGWVVVDFVQSHDQVTGTFHAADGTAQTLTGQVHGDELRLSRFDGAAALLLIASVTASGAIEGGFWTNATGSGRWRAERNPDAELPGAGASGEPIVADQTYL